MIIVWFGVAMVVVVAVGSTQYQELSQAPCIYPLVSSLLSHTHLRKIRILRLRKELPAQYPASTAYIRGEKVILKSASSKAEMA